MRAAKVYDASRGLATPGIYTTNNIVLIIIGESVLTEAERTVQRPAKE